jgi:hypothetical protein
VTAPEAPLPPDDGRPAVDPAARWIKSAEMHKILRRHLKPFVTQYGFKVSREGLTGWARPLADRHVVFWIQANPYNDPILGGSFTMEFQLSPRPAAAVGSQGVWRQRIGYLMEQTDINILTELRRIVFQDIPTPPPGQPWFAGGKWRCVEVVDIDRRLLESARVEQVRIPSDVWFPFFNPDHVEAWGQFLTPRLPVLMRAFLESEVAKEALVKDPSIVSAIEEGRRLFPGAPPSASTFPPVRE